MNPCLIKICGLRSQSDVDAVVQGGADMGGFIFAPSSPRYISPEQAASLHSHNLIRVGVFVSHDLRHIMDTICQARLQAVQLHADQPGSCVAALRRQIQALRIIRVLWPERYASRQELEKALHEAVADSNTAPDVMLLDAGKAGGGSGAALPWQKLCGLSCPRPWILAGGLTAHNVRQAMDTCAPQGVDLNSGLENTLGHKCAHTIKDALRALRG